MSIPGNVKLWESPGRAGLPKGYQTRRGKKKLPASTSVVGNRASQDGGGQHFKKLLEPFQIGQMEIRNRIVMPAMGTRYGSGDGSVTERLKNYYEARAQGGTGLIIVEATYVHLRGKIGPNRLGIDDDKFISGLGELARTIQKHGARAVIQLCHAGRLALPAVIGMQPVGPSAVPMDHFVQRVKGEIPKEMTVEEIAELVISFANAARRAKEAGFDAVELHSASGYLFAQFLSRAANRREDAYGGSVENRARFLIETIKAVKGTAGPNYPVICRMNAKEHGVEDGITLEEARETALLIQEAGADAIHVTASGPLSPLTVGALPLVPGLNVGLAAEIKKVVAIPVIAVGLISPELGEKLIAEGKADFIAMGRALIADPELPDKLGSGRMEDIRPCLVCTSCPFEPKPPEPLGLQCEVNAALGRESRSKITPTGAPKRVLVVGSGPAGMESARVAALEGHEVFLYEKQSELGGHLIEASIPPHKERIGNLIRYLETQVRKLGVKVELGREVTPEVTAEVRPDIVLIATGATPIIPDIPGARKKPWLLL